MVRALRNGIGFAAFGLVMSLGERASAEAACLVRLHGPVTTSWSRAARAFEEDIASSPGDCASVDIQVDGRGASIELRTIDGRAAERRVQRPSEIEPLVRAMLIGFEPPKTPEIEVPSPPLESEPSSPSHEEAPPPIPDADYSAKPATAHVRPELFAAVGAGMEVQTNDGASPVGHALVGISLRAWQLGAFAKWEFEHHQDSDNPGHHSNLDAFGGGVMFGRRQAAGPVTLVFGSSFGVYSVDQESGGGHRNQILGPPTPHVEGSVADPRAGLYFGVLLPTTGRIRTRAQLDGEVAFVEHAAGSEFPNVPRWGLGLSVGVDFELSP